MTTESVLSRLKPSYLADKAAIEAAVQLRDKYPLLTEALNKAIVANNALKSEAVAALAASEAKVAELTEALKQHEQLLLINAVRAVAAEHAPLWLEAADAAAERVRAK